MPSAPLVKIEFESMELPVPDVTNTPFAELPTPPFPAALVPMKLPRTWFPVAGEDI